MADIPIGLLDTLIALVAGALFTLVGIIYRRLRKRISQLEEPVAELESAILETKKDIDTAHTWMFGLEDDATHVGIAAEIEAIQERLENTIDAMHDEDEIDFERDDVED